MRARVPFLFLISREIIFPPKRGQIVSVVTPFSSLSLSLYTTNGLLPLFSRRIARVHSWMTHPTRSARSHTHTHTQTQTEFVFDFFFFHLYFKKLYIYMGSWFLLMCNKVKYQFVIEQYSFVMCVYIYTCCQFHLRVIGRSFINGRRRRLHAVGHSVWSVGAAQIPVGIRNNNSAFRRRLVGEKNLFFLIGRVSIIVDGRTRGPFPDGKGKGESQV